MRQSEQTRRLSRNEARRQGEHVVEMQRRRLLLAVVEVFAEVGSEDASVGRICKRAGVSRRTFYDLFEDREECLLAAVDASIERISRPVLSAYEAQGDWLERLRNALVAMLWQFDADPDFARVCVIEASKGGPRVSDKRARISAALVAAVEEGRGKSRSGIEPPPLTGQGVVGGALSVIHARMLEVTKDGDQRPLSELAGSLMAMIVHPYLGPAAARRELERQTPVAPSDSGPLKDPFKDLSIRFTYRTARVLATIAADPGASNRLIVDSSGIADEGQMSRLLTRLQHAGLIENRSEGQSKGEPNAWALTPRGQAIHTTLDGNGS